MGHKCEKDSPQYSVLLLLLKTFFTSKTIFSTTKPKINPAIAQATALANQATTGIADNLVSRS